MTKTKVTLTIDEQTWRQFRAWAIGRGSNASHELEAYMRATLSAERVPPVPSRTSAEVENPVA